MDPLRKVPQVPDRGREMVQVGNMTQAGRSEVGLGAEKDSAEIRSQSSTITGVSPGLEGGESSGSILDVDEEKREKSSLSSAPRRDSSGSTWQRNGSGPTQAEGASTLSLNRRSSYAPVTPSPLNPASSQSSLNTSDENAIGEEDISPIQSSSSGDSSRRKNATNMPMATGGKRKGSNLSPAQKILRQKTMPPFRSGEVVRPENPRLLKDLGRDYSRYPSSRSSSMAPSRRATTSLDSRVTLLRTTTNNPFSDSQADLDKYGFPDDSIGAFDPYFGGEKGFILYENEVEEDDKWHVPADDDDVTFKPNWREYWDRRQMVSFVGGIFLIFGLLSIFIILPVLTFATNIYLPGGMLQSNSSSFIDYGPAWAHVTNRTFALLKNVRTGLIDPTTPTSAKTRTSTFDGSTLNLVFSDEFNGENRTFYPGDDPFWTAPNIWYGATQDMEWYDPVAVTTGGGTLQLTLSAFPNHGLQYMSGMLNSWNQLCFKGGVFEVSVSLPGPVVPGLWPGCWTLGNIGRPGYKATTEGTWPYTYQACDAGITPNQSSPDGMNFLPGQKLSSCTCKGEDHPNPGTGRGAPEIDILEAAVEPANLLGVVTQSYQVAPFDIFWRPNSNFLQIPNYETTQMNGYCGGPYQQAVSATTLLNPNWYNGTAYQKYAFEYIPGGPGTGKIAWFVGEDQSFMMDGRAIGPNGNVAARPVSQEPMSMVLNLGMSSAWGEVDIPNLIFPTVMNIDYVRIYQRPGHESITCDPPGYPTTEYIANHPKAYNNPNLTSWSETNYTWPKNNLTGDC